MGNTRKPPSGPDGPAVSQARRVRRKGEPLSLPRAHERTVVSTHRELVAMARTLASRIEQDPGFSVMLLANPVLALEQYGIVLSKAMQHHVLETLRHPPKLRQRRQALEASLQSALGERPQPNDAKWMARLVFELRGLRPLDTRGAEPTYRLPFGEETIERLQGARPRATKRYASAARRGKVRATLGVAVWRPSVRLLDLEVLPEPLPEIEHAPRTLTLEEAWFYKADPMVRDAVELGQIERRAFPFATPARFRELAAGSKLDAFGAYVRSVRILRALS